MNLDMTDAFDEENLDTFSRVVRQETLTLGRSTLTSTQTDGLWGVVSIIGPNDLQRLPESTRFTKGISVVTQNLLEGARTVAGVSYQPDLILWNGDQFLVVHVDPYGHAGSGFWQILAQSQTSQEPN